MRAGIGFVGAGSNGVFTAEAVGCLPQNETTMAEALGDSYFTAAVGKWHLGQQPQCLPTQRGFDYYFGIPFRSLPSPFLLFVTPFSLSPVGS